MRLFFSLPPPHSLPSLKARGANLGKRGMCVRARFSLSLEKRREAGGERDRRFNLTIERLRLPRLFFILFLLFFLGET